MKRLLSPWLQNLFKIASKQYNSFLTVVIRPRQFTKLSLVKDSFKKLPKSAVVVQGPLVKEDEFTLNTFLLYKKTFIDSQLILSTWEGENKEAIRAIKKLGVKVILNKMPDPPLGSYTTNLQIVSSFEGIKLAKKLGCTYVLKTRTDQRLYATNLMVFLISLLKMFPPTKGFKQRFRLIVPSMYTFKYRMYSVTDMTVFSHISEMMKLYGIKLDDRPINDKKVYNTLTNIEEIAKYRLGEMYFTTEYLKIIGKKLRWTLHDYWQSLKDNFIVVDQSIFDIYWAKYNSYHEYRHSNYELTTNKSELTFKDWLTIYHNLDDMIVPEYTQKLGFDDSIAKP